MKEKLLLKNIRLPLSNQWKDSVVDLLVEGEMIKSVEPNMSLSEDFKKETGVIEGRGRIVLPGLVDAHAHLVQTAMASIGVDLSPAKTIDEALEILRAHAEKSDSDIIFGHTFDPSALREHRYFTLEDFDKIENAVRGRIVYVPRRDYHSSVVNRAGLEKIPFPEGVVGIQTESDGKTPSGILKHQAAGFALKFYHQSLPLEEKQEAIRQVCSRAAACGVTTIHVLEEPDLMDILLPIRDFLPVDTVPYSETLDVSYPCKHGFRSIGGCDALHADGSFSSHTAALYEPFYDDPSVSGNLYFSDEEMFDFVQRAHNGGLQICVHVQADRAVTQVLTAYEKALEKNPREDHRHRLEHAELVRPEDYQRVVDGGFYLSMQPTFEYLWGGPDGMYAKYLGPERRLRTNTFRTWWDMGAVIAGGSDADVSPLDSRLGIHSLVNNPNEEQRLTVGEAIQVFTENGAKIGFEDTVKGWTVPGFQADLIMLEEDPFEASAGIKDIEVALTLHKGRKVHEKNRV